jgi:hypothetical protein
MAISLRRGSATSPRIGDKGVSSSLCPSSSTAGHIFTHMVPSASAASTDAESGRVADESCPGYLAQCRLRGTQTSSDNCESWPGRPGPAGAAHAPTEGQGVTRTSLDASESASRRCRDRASAAVKVGDRILLRAEARSELLDRADPDRLGSRLRPRLVGRHWGPSLGTLGRPGPQAAPPLASLPA